MSPAVIHQRRGITVLGAEPGVARNVRFVFNLRGLWPIEPAFANLAPSPNDTAHGVLYTMTPDQLRAIKRWESAAYTDMVVDVETASGHLVAAHAFSGRWTMKRPGRPSRRYLALLLDGAQAHGLPTSYIDALAATPSAYVPVLSPVLQRLATWERLLSWWKRTRNKETT